MRVGCLLSPGRCHRAAQSGLWRFPEEPECRAVRTQRIPRVGDMTWQAKLAGDPFGLSTLENIFNTGDPTVSVDANGDYVLESASAFGSLNQWTEVQAAAGGATPLILRFLSTTHGGSLPMNRGCQSPNTWITSSTGSAPMQQRLVIWS